MTTSSTPFNLSGKVIGLIAGAIVLLLVVGGVFISYNNTRNTMIKKEQALSAQYQANQVELSSYVSSIKESLGVANTNSQALNEVLSDAVKGRYEGETSANPAGGAMFSAITEAYPELDSTSIPYQKVQDAVLAGRTAYKNKQTKLLDMLRDYESWKNSGLINSQMAKLAGAPSDNLRAQIGDDIERGQEALDRMYNVVLTKDAKDAYQSGEMEPLELGPETP